MYSKMPTEFFFQALDGQLLIDLHYLKKTLKGVYNFEKKNPFFLTQCGECAYYVEHGKRNLATLLVLQYLNSNVACIFLRDFST